MSKGWLAVLLIGSLTVSASAMADPGKQNGKGNPHSKQASADHGRGDNHDEDGWQRRGNDDYRIYGDRDGRPPGWSRGKKTGWGNCGLPPGQAKKYGCRAYAYQGRQYYYYQDDAGRIIVRRPSVRIHGGIDVH
jgi:hypothetical protein